jgi:CheY-like chemotaxis protein
MVDRIATGGGFFPGMQPNNNMTSSTAATDRPLNVLVIEDNRDLARLFCDLLEVMGCVAQVAWSAQSGLEAAQERVPDLIFCDLGMPGDKDGFDVAAEVRRNASLANTWLIAVTGFAEAETHERARNTGFNRVFAKPVKFAQLQNVLNEYRAARSH